MLVSNFELMGAEIWPQTQIDASPWPPLVLFPSHFDALFFGLLLPNLGPSIKGPVLPSVHLVRCWR